MKLAVSRELVGSGACHGTVEEAHLFERPDRTSHPGLCQPELGVIGQGPTIDRERAHKPARDAPEASEHDRQGKGRLGIAERL